MNNLLIEKIYAATYDTNLTILTNNISLQGLVSKIANLFGIIAGALAFIFLLYSGILYITAGGNVDQAKKAQAGIINAIIGIIIVVLAYVIFSAVRNGITSIAG